MPNRSEAKGPYCKAPEHAPSLHLRWPRGGATVKKKLDTAAPFIDAPRFLSLPFDDDHN